MDSDSGNWQSESGEDIQESSRIDDPLAELATQIAIACQAIEEHNGSFCTACTCIGYHVLTDSQECELCGCDGIYWLCVTCGTSRSIETFEVGSQICKFCINIQPVRIKPDLRVGSHRTGYNVLNPDMYYTPRTRGRAARKALRELTE